MNNTCRHCGKENQPHYKFCAGCGQELADAAPATSSLDERPQSPFDPPGGGLADMLASAFNTSESPAPPTKSASTPAARICPSCGNVVPPDFSFCGKCGARVGNSAPPVARTQAFTDPVAAPRTIARGRLVLMRPDGSEGGTHVLHEGENTIGRGYGPLFDGDGYLSPRHAQIIISAQGIVVRDLSSLNGVFVRMTIEEPIAHGDIFRIGQELLRFERLSPPEALEDGTELLGSPNPGYWGRLALIVGRGVDGSAFPLIGDSVILGRERGDILFSEDGYVSGAHCRVSLRGSKTFLTDLNSSNGTFTRLAHERKIPSGAMVLMGQQLFKVIVG